MTPGRKFCRNCNEIVVKDGASMEHDLTNAANSEEESQSFDFEAGKEQELDISFERADVSSVTLHSFPNHRKISLAN